MPTELKPLGSTRARVLDRAARHGQSRGVYNIARVGGHPSLKWHAWFHSLVHLNTWGVVAGCLGLYTVVVVGLAPFYLWVSDSCGLQIHSFTEALYLSLETMVTIGYGVPDPYFQGCMSGLVVILVSSLLGILLDALLLGVLFTRFARPGQRASSILFSDSAVVRMVGGRPLLQFRVVEMRKHQLLEAHVSCYALRPDSGHCSAMRLVHPDDSLGASMVLMLPVVVSHAIDRWSPLLRETVDPPEVLLRDAYPCTVCAESYYTEGLLETHARYTGHVQQGADPVPRTLAQTQECLRGVEILCVVEGIDVMTGSTVQARHSYTSDDLHYGQCFGQCVTRDREGRWTVDFERLHTTFIPN